AVRAEIEILRRERLAYEQESTKTRQALARSEAHCRTLEARVAVLETEVHCHEWQRQVADDLAVQHIGKGYHTKRQKTKKKITKPGTEWKSCEGQSQIKAKDQKSQSQSQLNKLTVKTGAVIEEYYWMQSQPI
ncbi:hypothetical protein Tco_0930686, partial [Tanacetum coccineum]